MSIRKNRVETIQKIVRDSTSITIKNLAEELAVSKMTIRRDLDQILSNPKIQFIRGMLIYNPILEASDEPHYSVISAATLHQEAKKKIVSKAKSLLELNDIILIDAGSTTEMLARILPEELKLDVICFSLNILNTILNFGKCSITLPGGKLHCSSMVFESREGIELLKKTRVKKAFISAYGVDIRLGVTCSADFERELKMTAINTAEQRILLADSSKFGKVTNFHFADLENFEIIITDKLLPKELANEIRSRDITQFMM